MSNPLWSALVSFFQNLGDTIMQDIITALPEVEQGLLAAVSALIQAGVAYVQQKYGTIDSAVEGTALLTAEQKLSLDNSKHNEAFNYVKNEIAKNPNDYPNVPDSLLHCGIEIYYQKLLRDSQGNHGNGGPTGDFSK